MNISVTILLIFFSPGITSGRLYDEKEDRDDWCRKSVVDLASGAEIMGNREMLLFSKSGKVIRLDYNTPAPGYPKAMEEEFPEFKGMGSIVSV